MPGYPDENSWWPAYAKRVEAQYAEAGQAINIYAFWWYTRTAFDIGQGGDPIRVADKHIAELREALGLGQPRPKPPVESPIHVKPDLLTVGLVEQVVAATAKEFPRLTQMYDSDREIIAAAQELKLRIIWHLYLVGFLEVGEQQNPSGTISGDKFCVKIPDNPAHLDWPWTWHAYDIMSLGYTNYVGEDGMLHQGRPTSMVFLEVGSPNPQISGGVPDGL